MERIEIIGSVCFVEEVTRQMTEGTRSAFIVEVKLVDL